MTSTSKLIILDDYDKWTVDFFENGIKCNKQEIDLVKSPIAKQYAAYFLISEDLDMLLEWVKELYKKIKDFEKSKNKFGQTDGVLETLDEHFKNDFFMKFSAVSIIYGRIFTSNKSRGIYLNHKDFVTKEHYNTHDELMKVRNTYIAHSSNKKFEEAKVFKIINPKNEEQFIIVAHSKKVYFPTINGGFFIEIINHLNDLSKLIKSKVEELNLKITEKSIKNDLPLIP